MAATRRPPLSARRRPPRVAATAAAALILAIAIALGGGGGGGGGGNPAAGVLGSPAPAPGPAAAAAAEAFVAAAASAGRPASPASSPGANDLVAKWKALKAADFYVPTIPGLDAKEALQLNMHAGLIPVDLAMNASTFFWTIEARVPQPRRKLLFWFNGGPGCSSMDGVFLENGPFHVTPESKVVMKKFSWIQAATVVFVDQPLGTGYSTYDQTPGTFGAPAKTLEQVTSYLRTFMNGFYTVFPHLLNSDVYFGGESYAGVYIPYFATSITSSGSNWPPMSMKGLIIGNGWMDPLHQYPAFIEYGQDNNLIGGTYLESAKASWVACEEAYKALNTVPIKLNVCEKILETILQYSTKDGGTCINMYDIRVYDDTVEGGCGLFEWPTGLQDMKKYLGRADLKTAVHVPNNGVDMTWTECSPVVGAALSSDKSEAPYKLLPALLEKIPVLLFQGDKDLICNWYGLRDMVDNLTWNGAKGFGDAKKEKWILNGTEAGWYKSARGLTFGLIYNASHMAPFGSPLETMDMFNRFIGAKYLADDMIVGTVVGEAKKPSPSPSVVPVGDKGTAPDGLPPEPSAAAPEPEAHAPGPKKFNFVGGVLFLLIVVFGSMIGYSYVRSRLDGRPVTSGNVWDVFSSTWGFKRVPTESGVPGPSAATRAEWHELRAGDNVIFSGEFDESDRIDDARNVRIRI